MRRYHGRTKRFPAHEADDTILGQQPRVSTTGHKSLFFIFPPEKPA